MQLERSSRIGLLACFSTLAFMVGCHQEPRVVQATAGPAATVSLVASEMTNWPTGSDAVGTVRSRVSATLSSRVMGYVRDVRVQAGDHVTAGQVVAVLDARDLEVAYR